MGGDCGRRSGLSLSAVLSVSCGGVSVPPDPAGYRVQAEGLGRDGDVTVMVAGQVLNRYAVLGADANPGNTTLTLSSTPGQGLDALLPLSAGDLLLLMQMQGAEIRDDNSPRFGEVLDPAAPASSSSSRSAASIAPTTASASTAAVADLKTAT